MWSSVTDRLTSWTKLLRGQRGGGVIASSDVGVVNTSSTSSAPSSLKTNTGTTTSSSLMIKKTTLPMQHEINEIFRQNLTDLEHFVINEVEVEQLERWLIRATRQRQNKISEREQQQQPVNTEAVNRISDNVESIVTDETTIISTDLLEINKDSSTSTSSTTTTTTNTTNYLKSSTLRNNGTQHISGNKNGRKTSLSRWKFCVHADKRQMLQELTRSLQLRPTKLHVLWELASCISSAVGGDGFRLYIASANGDPDRLHLYQQKYRGERREQVEEEDIGEGEGGGIGQSFSVPSDDLLWTGPYAAATSAASAVARTRVPLRLTRDELTTNYQDTLPPPSSDAHYILVHPMVQPDGELAAVLEVWRPKSGSPFHEEEEEIATSYLVWGGIALHYAHLYLSINKQRRLNEFLLDVVKSIFQDMVSMDALVLKVMNFAQRLVDADRASLFLVDSHSKELYARIFDVGSDDMAAAAAAAAVPLHMDGCHQNQGSSISSSLAHHNIEQTTSITNKPKEIRFPLGTGIAGQVALTGEVLNIADAYLDPRFNRNIDQLTGYHTRTILCMPIFIRNHVIGVVQMVNKRAGAFNKEDEESFEMFAVYCGLALHHAKLYDKIARSEQKYRVALDVLSYHNTCSEAEVAEAQQRGIPQPSPGLDDYYFTPNGIDDFEKARQAVCMFSDLFGLATFERENLYRFTLTVKKNYRRVPYHNWTHGFNVANCMYAVLKRAKNIFSRNERLALFVGSLCHDLDHRGKNNKFMSDTESPLAAIYTTSTMEHHHFNQTVTILQQKGHNIFSHLTSDDYKEVLGHLKHCILATDLALFFPNRRRLTELVTTHDFNWNNREHRLLLEAITMTASDLSASAKPWPVQVETVKVIFEEFYEQGDAERAAGRIPLPMMDRNQPEQQAASQVGFLMGICLPCYRLLYQLIPETKPLLDQCQSNLERWMSLDAETKANEPHPRLRLNLDHALNKETTINMNNSNNSSCASNSANSTSNNNNTNNNNKDNEDEDDDDEAIIAESKFRGLGRLDELDLITPPIE